MSCVVQSTGQMQCKVYDSMLALSSDLQTAQSLVVVSILTGFVGLLMVFVSSMCTNFIVEEAAKTKVMVVALLALIRFFTMYNSCFGCLNVWGYLVVMIRDLCSFVKLSLGSRFG